MTRQQQEAGAQVLRGSGLVSNDVTHGDMIDLANLVHNAMLEAAVPANAPAPRPKPKKPKKPAK